METKLAKQGQLNPIRRFLNEILKAKANIERKRHKIDIKRLSHNLILEQ